MEKSDILQIFLQKGYQIDVESLNYFYKDEKAFKKFLEEIERKNIPATITIDLVNSVLKQELEISEYSLEKKTLTVEDLAKVLFERFTLIRKILVSHLDLVNLVSINKINDKTKNFSLIGIVIGKDESIKTISVADDTGEINLKIDAKSLDEILVNDVLGFVCEKNAGVSIQNIVFPDVPLRRNVKPLHEEASIIFTKKITQNILDWFGSYRNATYVFSFSGHSMTQVPDKMKIISIGKNPTKASIMKAISLFLFDGTFLLQELGTKKVEDFVLSLFRKRYFNAIHSLDSILFNNSYIMQEIPDIVVIDGLNSASQNIYKGTTLLTLDENTAWIVNLKTREIIKLSLS